MINYFLKFIHNIKMRNTYNLVEEFKGSSVDIKFFNQLVDALRIKYSIEDGSNKFVQIFNKKLKVVWQIVGNIKKIISIETSEYKIVIGLKNFIVKIFNSPIKDIRYNLKTGFINKINFIKTYFINFVDFEINKVSMGLKSFSIKQMFNKNKLSELTVDEWDLLELNTLS